MVLSFNYWMREFGGDPHVVNQTLHINAHPFTIVGVAPPQFHSIVAGSPQDVFVPISTKNIITPRWQDLDDHNSYWMTVVGRLKPGVSREQAEISTGLLWHSLREEEFKTFTHQARWRKRFLDDAKLQMHRQRARLFAASRSDGHAVDGADGHGGAAGDHGLRQRVEPAAGSGRRTRA